MKSKVYSYCNNIDKVIFPERVQDSVDGVFGNGHFQTLHAAAGINHNDDVLRRGGSLDIPATERERIFLEDDQNRSVYYCIAK